MTSPRDLPCIYCERSDDPAPDHVPPRLLFVPPLPSDLVTVPSCSACNRSFSKDDEYLRAIMVMRRETADHPATAPLLETLWRSIERSQGRRFGERIARSIVNVELSTPSGIQLGTTPAYVLESERLQRILARFVRALYYHEHKERLPDEVEVLAHLKFEQHTDIQKQVLPWLTGRPIRAFGRHEFQYTWVCTPENRFTSLWLFVFHGVTHYLVFTVDRARTYSAGPGAA